MKQSYPTANVIMLFTLLTPMLFGIVMGLPLGIFILPMIVASMLYGFLPALACGIWLAAWRTRGTLWGRLHAAGLCMAVAVRVMTWVDRSVVASGWLFWVLLAAGVAAVVSAWCFLPAPLVAPVAEEGCDETA